MSTSYQRAIRQFSKTDRQQIGSTLLTWTAFERGRIIVPNLQDLERFLPGSRMHALLGVVQACYGLPTDELERRYQQECFNHVGRGGMVRLNPQPTIVGRAVDREEFINWLLRKYKAYFYVRRNVIDFVMRLTGSGSLTETEKKLLASEYLAWATFDASVTSAGPFSFLVYNLADEVRACLGMNPRLRNRLLLLTFDRPRRVKLRRPTITDAELFVFFQPPPMGLDAHGQTRTWPREFLTGKLLSYNPIPRPEALMPPVAFKYLQLPVRELI